MKPLVPLTFLVIFLFGAVRAAETKSAAAAAANAATKSSLAGKYSGKWKGPEDSGGELRVTLKQDESASAWIAEASFTYEGADIPTTMKGVTIEGTRKVRLVFTWQIQDTPGQSAMIGELTGDTLQGTYETTGPAGNSKGTWSARRS